MYIARVARKSLVNVVAIIMALHIRHFNVCVDDQWAGDRMKPITTCAVAPPFRIELRQCWTRH